MVTGHFDTIRLGIKSLALHKLRSFLTILGLLFGVSSVISMLAVGEVASYEALEQITAAMFKNFGMEGMLTLNVPSVKAAA